MTTSRVAEAGVVWLHAPEHEVSEQGNGLTFAGLNKTFSGFAHASTSFLIQATSLGM